MKCILVIVAFFWVFVDMIKFLLSSKEWIPTFLLFRRIFLIIFPDKPNNFTQSPRISLITLTNPNIILIQMQKLFIKYTSFPSSLFVINCIQSA